ncbi:anthranilate synthase component II [Mesoterricola silvestris]|uniref:Aminodeoxychorismate/anthranilate synthase component II n=1 Tax=Mesoterricola silvestris TaxID=2927979 RepID=A0AA48K8V2_9BACT|nr:aminodeoxychorismate/anthranilate synthase component II [Mesoterricola silvestris]BDU73324.1 aminodeoxychorismate/anthranilate synthase component II [Mesoterricola silvestris]
MILFVDNYDSFTYNLVSMIGALEPRLEVVRNDALTVEKALAMDLDGLVISPGPGHPRDAGVCIDLVRALAPRVPILGVCLGHQVLVEAFGGRVIRAGRPMHGKTSLMPHDGTGLLAGLPDPLQVGRYHSLAAEASTLPECLAVQGATADGEVMAIRHREFPCHGVQFHPESILTPDGAGLLANFVGLCRTPALN